MIHSRGIAPSLGRRTYAHRGSSRRAAAAIALGLSLPACTTTPTRGRPAPATPASPSDVPAPRVATPAPVTPDAGAPRAARPECLEIARGAPVGEVDALPTRALAGRAMRGGFSEAVFSDDEQLLALATADAALWLWDLGAGTAARRLRASVRIPADDSVEGYVTDSTIVAFSRDGRWLYESWLGRCDARFWGTRPPRETARFADWSCLGSVVSLPDSRFLLALPDDPPPVRVHAWSTGRRLASLQAPELSYADRFTHASRDGARAWAHDPNRYVSYGSLSLWNVSAERLSLARRYPTPAPVLLSRPADDDTQTLFLTADGSVGRIARFAGEPTLEPLPCSVQRVASTSAGITPDGRRVVVSDGLHVAIVHRSGPWRQYRGERACTALAVSPRARWLVTTCTQGDAVEHRLVDLDAVDPAGP